MPRLASSVLAAAVLASPLAARGDQPDDPSRDHVALFPTAWSLPAGRWSVTNLMVAMMRLATTVHPRWSLELSGGLPNSAANVAAPAVAFRLHETDSVRVIARADAIYAIDHDTDDMLRPFVRSFMVRRQAWAAGMSIIGGTCLGGTCRASASAGLRAGWSEIDDAGYPESSATLTAFIPIGRPLLFASGEVEMCHRMSGCYGLAGNAGGGIRFAGTRWALTLGWLKTLADKQPSAHISDLTPAGSPWFSVTYLHP